MHIAAIKTHKITTADTSICEILDRYVTELPERSVLAVTSKIVAICEGRVVTSTEKSKAELVREEASYYIPPEESKYHITMTVTRGMLVATAGIDESNINGGYVLWPADPQKSANLIREYLMRRFGIKECGVVITDSRTTPLRWGVTGAAIAYSGFEPVRDMIGTPDIFGRLLKVTKVNVYDSLAGAAVFVMGEGNEQTPLALITELPSVAFVDHNPTDEEVASLQISLDEDLFAPLLVNAPWKKGAK